ncbi:glycosyltransferase [Microbulbifer sp. YPW1]|uniref:glycosyltransferase family 2 protein n=1 Tax=Microbulbifer sp. YPW1 TaxID=2745199 RepID=UPI001597FA70|nr:glycosyltransferase [Microbulbifer sp. YPW1]QKX15827.1 glycosyltransferase family 2 protein [Microbulbifer sp. YPW1]
MLNFRLLLGELRRWLNRRHPLQITALEDTVLAGTFWRCSGGDPSLNVFPSSGLYPRGWYMLELELSANVPALPCRLYADYGHGYKEVESFSLTVEPGQLSKRVCYFPARARTLRLDPCDFPAEVRFDHFKLLKITRGFAVRVMVRKLVNAQKYESIGDARAVGWRSLFQAYDQLFFPAAHSSYQTQLARQRASYSVNTIVERLRRMPVKPKISVVLPVYNPPLSMLKACLDSVLAQSYSNWQLCIADDASTDPLVTKTLLEYADCDPRINLVRRFCNGHICAASNSALSVAQGDYVALLDHDDCLFEHALLEVATAIQSAPNAEIFYSDEDFIDGDGNRFSPHYKPDWNPALLLSHNYVTHLAIYRRTLLDIAGGFREGAGVEGAQDYDLILRCSALSSAEKILHIPKVLYHWRAHEGSTALSSDQKSYTSKAGRKALQDYLDTQGIAARALETEDDNLYRVDYQMASQPLVSLLIPTRDMLSVLRPCVESILSRSTYSNFEILILDNQSRDSATLAWFSEVQNFDSRVRVLAYDHPFNYSAINNFGVTEARGEIIGLINNDVEVITPGWIEELASLSQQPENGCVGALLYYPDDTVQHAGVILGLGGYAAHSHRGSPRGSQGYFNRLKVRQNLSAVTGACLFVRKSVYEQVGGLDEAYTVAYNDVDFCLRVQAAGYLNVFTPFAELYHHESKSRGQEDTPEKIARFDEEKARLAERWGALLQRDPFYHPNLTRAREDFSLAGQDELAVTEAAVA